MKYKNSSLVIIFGAILTAIKTEEFCGIRNGFIATVFGGEETVKGEWPWSVAFVKRLEERFFCGGTLVGSKFVLSGELKELFYNILQLKRIS